MNENLESNDIRAKKLGVLIYDARLASRRNIQECAQAIGTSVERFQEYENGAQSPSLPEIEGLAYYFNIPPEHFWGNLSLSENITDHQLPNITKLISLRQRMIGALLRQARLQANLSIGQVGEKTRISEDDLQKYELGEQPVPLPIIVDLVNAFGSQIETFRDHHGPIANWVDEQHAIQGYLKLSSDVRDFIGKPSNLPYLKLAIHLSELSVEKLRSVAESLLEITY